MKHKPDKHEPVKRPDPPKMVAKPAPAPKQPAVKREAPPASPESHQPLPHDGQKMAANERDIFQDMRLAIQLAKQKSRLFMSQADADMLGVQAQAREFVKVPPEEIVMTQPRPEGAGICIDGLWVIVDPDMRAGDPFRLED